MPDAICDTSPLQYLYQLDRLHLLPRLIGKILVPEAVVQELAIGQLRGIPVPDPVRLDWVEIHRPASVLALPLITDLGSGETEVLALALEHPGVPVILDDGLARRTARRLGIPRTGTLGILLDAKQAGLIPAVAPLLDALENLNFRLAARTRRAVLDLAGEP